MILLDVNLLIYAHDENALHHERARNWWEERLNGTAMIGLPWISILGFVRLMTNPRMCKRPYAPAEILAVVENWLNQAHVQIVQPSDRHFEIISKFLRHAGTAGNLTTDAHLAALAIERGLVLQTNDSDFGRFPGLKWHNPLA